MKIFRSLLSSLASLLGSFEWSVQQDLPEYTIREETSPTQPREKRKEGEEEKNREIILFYGVYLPNNKD